MSLMLRHGSRSPVIVFKKPSHTTPRNAMLQDFYRVRWVSFFNTTQEKT